MLDVVTPADSIVSTEVSLEVGLAGLKLKLCSLPRIEERVKASGGKAAM